METAYKYICQDIDLNIVLLVFGRIHFLSVYESKIVQRARRKMILKG